MTQDIDIGKLSEQINDKADKDLWNTVPNVWNNTLNTSQITNCITAIPQDIKLELNNGVLTLKAGSKVYVPNGAGRFYEATIGSDLSTTGYHDGQIMIFAQCSSLSSTSINAITEALVSNAKSGTSPEASIYYNTSLNMIYRYTSSTAYDLRFALPIAICTRTSGKITSIDQVFNGFGYIGSTVFALPGVKGLIPNGRNADGSLKNLEFTVSSVLTNTQTNTAGKTWGLYFNPDGSHNGFSLGVYKRSIKTLSDRPTTWKGGYCIYVEDENRNYINQNTASSLVIIVADIVIGSSSITSFTPKLPFRAVDWNDRETVVGWGMPDWESEVAIVNTTGGFIYTPPTNGYLKLNKGGANTTAQCFLYKGNSENGTLIGSNITNRTAGTASVYNASIEFQMIMVEKGQQYYFKTDNINMLRISFVPCKGVN